LFLGKAEQRKLTDLAKIPREHLIRLRVCRVEAPLRRRGFLQGSACGVGLLPGALVERQDPEDVIIVRQRGTLGVVVIERAQEWARFVFVNS